MEGILMKTLWCAFLLLYTGIAFSMQSTFSVLSFKNRANEEAIKKRMDDCGLTKAKGIINNMKKATSLRELTEILNNENIQTIENMKNLFMGTSKTGYTDPVEMQLFINGQGVVAVFCRILSAKAMELQYSIPAKLAGYMLK
jgi:hypothetical protein